MAAQPPRSISIVIAAMGGQGGGVLSSWIVDVAEHNGYLAQATSVPGVAQRTGATIYYIELFSKAVAEQAGADPVLALMPIPGQVDVVIAAELMEAGRALLRGFVDPERTTVIASSHREYAVTEKMAIGDGIADSDEVLAAVKKAALRCVSFDMAALAAATESVISSVLFGALAGTARLPFGREHYESAIERSGIAVQRSLAGFAAGFERAAGGENGSRHDVGEQPSAPAPAPAPALAPAPFRRARALLERVSETFPAAAKPLIIEGVRRLADYQDFGYADAYLYRLEQISELDDGGDDKAYRLSSETGRYLALWMSYEDAPSVWPISRFVRHASAVFGRKSALRPTS